jgi:hypothetical protein
MTAIEDVIHRVFGEYLEMPGLRLTVEQVGRLCGVERPVCERVLGALTSATFLSLTPDGHYIRATDGPHVRLAKADLNVHALSDKAS